MDPVEHTNTQVHEVFIYIQTDKQTSIQNVTHCSIHVQSVSLNIFFVGLLAVWLAGLILLLLQMNLIGHAV